MSIIANIILQPWRCKKCQERNLVCQLNIAYGAACMHCKKRKTECCWAPKWRRFGDHVVTSIRGTQQPRKYLTEMLERCNEIVRTGGEYIIPLEDQAVILARWNKMRLKESQSRAEERRSRSRRRSSSIASTARSASSRKSRNTSATSQKRGRKSARTASRSATRPPSTAYSETTSQGRVSRLAGRSMTPARPQQHLDEDEISLRGAPHRQDSGKFFSFRIDDLVLIAY